MNIASSSRRSQTLIAEGRDLDGRAERLRALARQLWFLADAYGEDASRLFEPPWGDAQHHKAEVALSRAQLRVLAAQAYTQRRLRDRMFTARLFGEPAWDMLLDLFVRSIDGLKVRTTEMTLSSMAAPTTALRWIDALLDAGLIERADCTTDRRVRYLNLTTQGMDLMVRYLTDMVSETRAGSRYGKRADRAQSMAGHGTGPTAASTHAAGAFPSLKIPRSTFRARPEAPASGEPRTSSGQRTGARFFHISRAGEQLLLRLVRSPGHVVSTEDLIAALGTLDHFNKGHVQRGLKQLRMALTGAGIDKPIARRNGGYVLSPEAAAWIMEHLHAR